MQRSKKRTAGERRYRQLKARSECVKHSLMSLQISMQQANAEGKEIRQMRILQTITESIERLDI